MWRRRRGREWECGEERDDEDVGNWREGSV